MLLVEKLIRTNEQRNKVMEFDKRKKAMEDNVAVKVILYIGLTLIALGEILMLDESALNLSGAIITIANVYTIPMIVVSPYMYIAKDMEIKRVRESVVSAWNYLPVERKQYNIVRIYYLVRVCLPIGLVAGLTRVLISYLAGGDFSWIDFVTPFGALAVLPILVGALNVVLSR